METLKHIITVNGRHGNTLAVYNNNIIVDEIFYIGDKYDRHVVMQLTTSYVPKLFKFTMHKKTRLDKKEYESEQIALDFNKIKALETVDYPFERFASITYTVPKTNETFEFLTNKLKKNELDLLTKYILDKTNMKEEYTENPNAILEKDFKWNYTVLLTSLFTIYITISFILKYSNCLNLLIGFNIIFAIVFSPVLLLVLKAFYDIKKKVCHRIYK